MGIRPTFMGFESASRGMRNSQKALDISLNNISNMDKTGYTRQRVDLVSTTLDYRNSRYHPGVALAGQGATISGISQTRDAFLDRRFREEYSDVGYYSAKSQILTDIDSAIGEIEPDPLSTALDKFNAAWMSLKEGDDTVAASSVLTAAKTLAQVFQHISGKLNNVYEQQKYDLQIDVKTVNVTLQKIADLNDAIKKEYTAMATSGNSYYMPNELLDQRNVLIDQLSGYADISVKNMADGTVEVTMAGKVVVKDVEYDQLVMRPDDYNKTVALSWNSTGKEITPISGSLKAAHEMINGRGTDGSVARGETFDNGLLYYKDKIDQFAKTLAKEFNSLVEIADPNGNPFTPPQYKTLFMFEDPSNPGAGNMIVNPAWNNNASYLYDGRLEQESEGTASTSYVDRALAMFNRKDISFGEYTGSITGYITFYSTTMLGSEIESTNSRLESSTDVTDDLLQRIYSISGVSRDEEAATAMQYQKAYEAVSRVMTVLDDMLDKLINGTGRAGL